MTLHPVALSDNEVSLESWWRLITIEPSLCELARRASRGGTPSDWTKLTTQLAKLAGPSARRERLRGVRSYESARAYLLGLFVRAGGDA